ncbi:MAG: hypothetical protein GY730_11795 [bacterium]|nr:hypothetical protein [bacterium]
MLIKSISKNYLCIKNIKCFLVKTLIYIFMVIVFPNSIFSARVANVAHIINGYQVIESQINTTLIDENIPANDIAVSSLYIWNGTKYLSLSDQSKLLKRSSSAHSGKYALELALIKEDDIRIPTIIYSTKEKNINFSKYKEAGCYLKRIPGEKTVQNAFSSSINVRIAVKEASEEIWIHPDKKIIGNEYASFGLALTEKKLKLAPWSGVENGKLDLDQITELQFYILSEESGSNFSICLDSLIIYGQHKNIYDDESSKEATSNIDDLQNIEPTSSNTTDVTNSLKSNTLFKTKSATLPDITETKVDQKEIIENDYVKTQPLISALINDPDFGVATWNIHILDAASNAVIQTETGNGKSVKLNAVEVSFQVTQPLADNKYKISISALDSNNNLAIYQSPSFQVVSEFNITDVLNGPNPFNPNQGVTNIQYQLSKDADVKVYIYSISGEKLWQASFDNGEFPGGTAGFNSIEWDGINSFGEVVATGPYIVYIIAKNGSDTKVGKTKILVLK